jgi:hypothetical protein
VQALFSRVAAGSSMWHTGGKKNDINQALHAPVAAFTVSFEHFGNHCRLLLCVSSYTHIVYPEVE